jgi:hypothetical protein
VASRKIGRALTAGGQHSPDRSEAMRPGNQNQKSLGKGEAYGWPVMIVLPNSRFRE